MTWKGCFVRDTSHSWVVFNGQSMDGWMDGLTLNDYHHVQIINTNL